MKKGQIWISEKNENIGIRIEKYLKSEKMWLIQHVDIINGSGVWSYLYENAFYSKIKSLYFKSPRH